MSFNSYRLLGASATRKAPPLLSNDYRHRSRLVLFLLFLGFATLVGRAFWIQVVESDFYDEQSARRIVHSFDVKAPRGAILDRAGRPLALSEPVVTVWADTFTLDGSQPSAPLTTLAAILGMSRTELDARLRLARPFVYLKRHISKEKAARLRQLGLPGLHFLKEWRRVYPQGAAVAQVLGFTDYNNRGQEGLELARDKRLTASAGKYSLTRDRLGRIISAPRVVQVARPGRAVRLTLDMRLQNLAYFELQRAIEQTGAKAGGAIVLDARNGEILALANWPSFNPARRDALKAEQVRNRVLTDVYEPGSTIKPINLALALERRVVNADTRINTENGVYRVGKFTIHDVTRRPDMSVRDVLRYSSNIGMLKIMSRLSPTAMADMFAAVGLSVSPPISFPGAAAGRVKPAQSWRPIEQMTMAYGYGMSLSLLQLAQSYTLLTADGYFQPASLILDGRPARHSAAVISPGTAATLRDMMEIEREHGATRHGDVENYRVAAKTGTARKWDGKSYSQTRYRTTFIGFAPLTAPRLIVAVMIDEPTRGARYGGPVAGPPFSRIMERSLSLLHVPPERVALALAESPSKAAAPATTTTVDTKEAVHDSFEHARA